MKVGDTIRLTEELGIIAVAYSDLLGVSTYPIGTTFRITELEPGRSFGVQLVINGLARANPYGTKQSEWHSPHSLSKFIVVKNKQAIAMRAIRNLK
jgi:hypothetical protein